MEEEPETVWTPWTISGSRPLGLPSENALSKETNPVEETAARRIREAHDSVQHLLRTGVGVRKKYQAMIQRQKTLPMEEQGRFQAECMHFSTQAIQSLMGRIDNACTAIETSIDGLDSQVDAAHSQLCGVEAMARICLRREETKAELQATEKIKAKAIEDKIQAEEATRLATVDGTKGLTKIETWSAAQLRPEDDIRSMQMHLVNERARMMTLRSPQSPQTEQTGHGDPRSSGQLQDTHESQQIFAFQILLESQALQGASWETLRVALQKDIAAQCRVELGRVSVLGDSPDLNHPGGGVPCEVSVMDDAMLETAKALERLKTFASTGSHAIAGIPVLSVSSSVMRAASPKALSAVVADLAQERGYNVAGSPTHGMHQMNTIISTADTIKAGLALEPFPSMETNALPQGRLKQPFDSLPPPPLPLSVPKQQLLKAPVPSAVTELKSNSKPVPLPVLPGAPPKWSGQRLGPPPVPGS